MDNRNYFKDLFESKPDYRKIVLMRFLTTNDLHLLHERGSLKMILSNSAWSLRHYY